MKVWIQRTLSASVDVEGGRIAETGRGFLVLVGVAPQDTPEGAESLAARVANLRIFEDAQGKTNLSIKDAGGEAIVVSQFTLYADTSHGNRPGFSGAARPETALPLYEKFTAALRERLGEGKVQTGRFGAHMRVCLVNDGPFSVELTNDK